MDARRIARLLPAVYQDAIEDGPVLAAVLSVMERLHAPDEAVIAGIDRYFDPRRAPDAFLETLARWLALGPYVDVDSADARLAAIRPAPLRDLIAIAAETARIRGTRSALLAVLRAATGVDGFAIDENPVDATGYLQPFHIRVVVPEAAAEQLQLVRRLVEGERPAWVTFELARAGGPKHGEN